MKMTFREMKDALPHDILKYVGPSSGGLIRNKLYTIKETSLLHVGFFMPKGQSINIDVNDHDLWEMHEAKGAAMAKEARLKSMTAEFNSHMNYVDNSIGELNTIAEDVDAILKDFPLDSKMKLLAKLSKDQLEVLDFLHKIQRNRLTTSSLVKAFKRNKNGT